MPFPLDDNAREFVRRHFKRKALEWTEDYFINVLETSGQKHDVYWATIALRDCGSQKCIPALKTKLLYPMQDVKCTALLTIAHVAGAAETELYTNALLDPAYRDKAYAMWAIRDAADARAVDAALSYFRKNLAKIRAGKLANGTLPEGLDYLQKFVDTQPAVAELFSEISKYWSKLAEGERKTIMERIPSYPWRPDTVKG